MHVDIISPGRHIFSGEAEYVQLPGTSGSFGVLDNHAPIISTLTKGKIKITDTQKQEQLFEIKGGVVEVKDNRVIVLAEE
ncbi:MAG: ATP synthase F1 subunit epsilon [Bacteroidetes bacterium]|nr:ATP synthase F1 subunit epsilon [Bacteroidota bacterium]